MPPAMSHTSLTLLLSELELPAADAWPQLPALQRLLSKGRREQLPDTQYQLLCRHFAVAQPAQGDLPIGPLAALGEGLPGSEAWWLCASPVHLVADRDQLFLSASATLGVTQPEAETLTAELNRLYAEDGWRFFAPHPLRWYLQLPAPVAMQTVPTSEAMGHRVGEVLPQGAGALAWQRVMTEVQMLLHGSSVNLQREAQGQLTINGLWFWGGGSLPQLEGNNWTRVVSGLPLSRALAQHSATPCVSPAEVALAKLAEQGGRQLWHSELTSWAQAEELLFAPLLAQLRAGELGELVVELPGLGRWRIGRAALRRWWRRLRPLATLLKEGA